MNMLTMISTIFSAYFWNPIISTREISDPKTCDKYDFFLLIHSLIQYKRDKLNIISFCLKLLIFSQFVKKNPELINPAFQTQKLKIEDFMVEEFLVEEFMVEEFKVEEFIVKEFMVEEFTVEKVWG